MSDTDDLDPKLAALIEALLPDEDEPAEDDPVASLSIDVSALAASLEARVRAFRSQERQARYAEAAAARQVELDDLVGQLPLPEMTHDERLAMATALLKQAGPRAAGVYFMKFEAATDAELDELIRTLRHLLKDDDEEG